MGKEAEESVEELGRAVTRPLTEVGRGLDRTIRTGDVRNLGRGLERSYEAALFDLPAQYRDTLKTSVRSGIGEITGANVAREALEDSRARFRQEQLARQRELEARQEADRLTALRRSRAAGNRTRGGGGSRGTGGVSLGADRDFLGL